MVAEREDAERQTRARHLANLAKLRAAALAVKLSATGNTPERLISDTLDDPKVDELNDRAIKAVAKKAVQAKAALSLASINEADASDTSSPTRQSCAGGPPALAPDKAELNPQADPPQVVTPPLAADPRHPVNPPPLTSSVTRCPPTEHDTAEAAPLVVNDGAAAEAKDGKSGPSRKLTGRSSLLADLCGRTPAATSGSPKSGGSTPSSEGNRKRTSSGAAAKKKPPLSPTGTAGTALAGARTVSHPLERQKSQQERPVRNRSCDGLFVEKTVEADDFVAKSSTITSGHAVSHTRAPRPLRAKHDPSAAAVGFRFQVFNMANAAQLRGFESVQGPDGRGQLGSTLFDPLFDGTSVDVAFVALPETPWDPRVQEFCYKQREATMAERLALRGSSARSASSTPGAVGSEQEARVAKPSASDDPSSLHGESPGEPQTPNTVVVASAQEHSRRVKSRLGSFIDGLAGSYNGDLKCIIAFSNDRFTEDSNCDLFAHFDDHFVAGFAVPNPKKSCIGRMLKPVDSSASCPRFLFSAAHFPILRLANILENDGDEALEDCKMVTAWALRKVLKAAGKSKLLDSNTILFLQGDLNSRTVLRNGKVHDILKEVLADDKLQADMSHGLGSWHEIGPQSEAPAHQLPVTYKFNGKSLSRLNPDGPGLRTEELTIGDVMQAAANGRTAGPGGSRRGTPEPMETSNVYRQTLVDAGSAFRAKWGIKFKEEKAFRPFRFPACADRIIYWAPHRLQKRLSWTFPKGGYDINHSQGGSDHKSVFLEAVLHVAPLAPSTASPRCVDFSPIADLSTFLDRELSVEDCDDAQSRGTQAYDSSSPRDNGDDKQLSPNRYSPRPSLSNWFSGEGLAKGLSGATSGVLAPLMSMSSISSAVSSSVQGQSTLASSSDGMITPIPRKVSVEGMWSRVSVGGESVNEGMWSRVSAGGEPVNENGGAPGLVEENDPGVMSDASSSSQGSSASARSTSSRKLGRRGALRDQKEVWEMLRRAAIKCDMCSETFSETNRRHYCSLCARAVCSGCTTDPVAEKARTCLSCSTVSSGPS